MVSAGAMMMSKIKRRMNKSNGFENGLFPLFAKLAFMMNASEPEVLAKVSPIMNKFP